MNVDLNVVYQVLRDVAARQLPPLRYGELSRRYEQATGDRVDPQFGWSEPLLAILNWCAAAIPPRPPLSALVVNEDGLPGSGFWGQGSLPPKPSVEAWAEMCNRIYGFTWPEEMD